MTYQDMKDVCGASCSLDILLHNYTKYFNELYNLKYKNNKSYNNFKNFLHICVSYFSIDNIFKAIRYIKAKYVYSHPIL